MVSGSRVRSLFVTTCVALVFALATGACSSNSNPNHDSEESVSSSTSKFTEEESDLEVEVEAGSALNEAAGSALRGDRDNPDFPPPVVDPNDILSGGVHPDGIPPIDNPQFASVQDTEYLSNSEGIIAVEVNGEVRGYPIQILIWHEIVNDTIDGVPVSVTYCPLCNSAVVFHRELGGQILDFGTSGELYQSALVMYDRQTESLWAHFTGQAIVGQYSGQELELIPAQTLSYRQFVERFPDALVLTTDTGNPRSYGLNPYVGYDDAATDPFGGFLSQAVDDRLPPKTRIVGVMGQTGPTAVLLEDLANVGVVHLPETSETGSAAERPVVVWHQAGLNSALEDSYVDAGRDVGQTGAFIAESADGEALTFAQAPGGDAFVDNETGSVWGVTGEALSGPLQGQQLTRVSHLDTFWFAWSTYRPETTLLAP